MNKREHRECNIFISRTGNHYISNFLSVTLRGKSTALMKIDELSIEVRELEKNNRMKP